MKPAKVTIGRAFPPGKRLWVGSRGIQVLRVEGNDVVFTLDTDISRTETHEAGTVLQWLAEGVMRVQP